MTVCHSVDLIGSFFPLKKEGAPFPKKKNLYIFFFYVFLWGYSKRLYCFCIRKKLTDEFYHMYGSVLFILFLYKSVRFFIFVLFFSTNAYSRNHLFSCWRPPQNKGALKENKAKLHLFCMYFVCFAFKKVKYSFFVLLYFDCFASIQGKTKHTDLIRVFCFA